MLELANLYVDGKVLSERHVNDMVHAAYAVSARCGYLISWNMKHLVRIQTINRVNTINLNNYYHSIIITTPTLITGEKPNEPH